MPQHFARSMSPGGRPGTPTSCWLRDERGAPRAGPRAPPAAHPSGWYGVANVKWLNRMEVRETRLINRFMARDYVTLRQDPARTGGRTGWK